MPDPIEAARKAVKRITPETVRGISSITRRSNIVPSGVGPARPSGNIQGIYPAGTLLPSSVLVTQGYRPGHAALDLAGPAGIQIYAPQELRITQAGQGAFGIDVIGINPQSGNRYTFGHFASIAPGLAVGQVIPAGTLIGFEGSTFTAPGYSTGPHVHLQVNSPGGAAVMPSAQDVLNTFVRGSVLSSPASPGVNAALLATSPQVTASLTSTGQVSQAVNSGGNSVKEDKPLTNPTSLDRYMGWASQTPAGLAGQKVNAALGTVENRIGFLASHTPADFALMGMGLMFWIIGVIILVKQLTQAEYSKELGIINQTRETVDKAAGSVAKIAAPAKTGG